MGIAADTVVETMRGPFPAIKLKAGDYVFGMDGLPTKIKAVQTYTPQQMFYVELSDGSGVEGDAHLAFPTKNWIQRLRYARGAGTQKNPKPRMLHLTTTTDLVERGLRHKDTTRFQYTVDTVQPLHYGYEDHAVPPFVAGLWYAKRSKYNHYVIPEHLFDYAKSGIQASRQFMVVQKKKHTEIRPSVDAMFIRDYPEVPTKEFPHKYWYGTPEQRLEFLQGFLICHPQAYNKTKDRFLIASSKRKLKNIQLICESLGIKTIMVHNGRQWGLTFRTRLPLFPHQEQAGRKTGEKYRRIIKIEPCKPQLCVHIETEKPIAVSDSYVPIWHSQQNKIKS